MKIIDLNPEHENAYCQCLEEGTAEIREIRTDDRAVFLEWGMNDALFIEGREVRNGPPPTYEKIKKKIARRLKKL